MFHDRPTLIIKPGFCIVVGILLLLLPLKWVLAWGIAAIVHEFGHCLALYLCKVRIISVTVGLSGAYIETEHMDNRSEFISAVAGPVSGICLLLLSHLIPYIAICALFQSLYNLLPISHYDGGRIMRCLLAKILPHNIAEKVYAIIEKATVFNISILAIVTSFVLKLGLFPIACAVLLTLKAQPIKFPCKQDEQIVQ